MAFWSAPVTNNLNQGPERHQAKLAHVILILMSAYFLIIGTINVFVFQNYPIAILDYAGMCGVLLIMVYFRRAANLERVSWMVSLLLVAVVLVFVGMADGQAYSIMWVTVLPPILFFLLGRTAGSWISLAVFLYIAGFVYFRMPFWAPAEASLASWLNIIEVLTAHWFLFRHYERSRSEALAELEHLSETDTLTGLYNRSRLDSHLKQQYLQHVQSCRPLTLIMCDIDHFKRINDEHGHLTGDLVLKEIAELLRDNMRATDFCGRWGGEEFLIICPDTPADAAAAIITKLQHVAATRPVAHGIRVSLSFGIAAYIPGESDEQLLRRADDALYAAKRSGRNRFVIADAVTD